MVCDEVYGVEDKARVFAEADFVVCSLPGTAHTEKFCDDACFRAMKPTGVFISIGRGKVVDEDALADALREDRIRGAAMDVFATEPLPEASPLWGLENVLLSPHNADFVPTFLEDAFEVVETNLKAFETGDAFTHTVDREIGY